MTPRTGYRWICSLVLCCLILVSCTATRSEPGAMVWIDVPLDGLVFSDLGPVNIKGHTASSDGVSRVEIFINDILVHSLDGLPMQGNLAHFQFQWTPSVFGAYAIKAIAYDGGNITGTPDVAHISFVSQAATVPETSTPDEAASPTPAATTTGTTLPPTSSSTPEAIIEFYADPPTIEASACTNLYWRVQNVQQVIFGGLQQPFEGVYRDCLCQSTRYTLTVIDNNGDQGKYSVDVTVTGTCATATPSPTPTPLPTPPDTTPPPPPTPYVPANGLVLSCRSALDLVWTPVEDPSGISEYQVQVQRHTGDNNWQDVSGSTFTGIQNKETNIPVECAWYYRWRVRAIDRAGNVSDWSVWFTFTITIG